MTALERATTDPTSFQKQWLGMLPLPSLSVLRLKLCPPTALTRRLRRMGACVCATVGTNTEEGPPPQPVTPLEPRPSQQTGPWQGNKGPGWGEPGVLTLAWSWVQSTAALCPSRGSLPAKWSRRWAPARPSPPSAGGGAGCSGAERPGAHIEQDRESGGQGKGPSTQEGKDRDGAGNQAALSSSLGLRDHDEAHEVIS